MFVLSVFGLIRSGLGLVWVSVQSWSFLSFHYFRVIAVFPLNIIIRKQCIGLVWSHLVRVRTWFGLSWDLSLLMPVWWLLFIDSISVCLVCLDLVWTSLVSVLDFGLGLVLARTRSGLGPVLCLSSHDSRVISLFFRWLLFADSVRVNPVKCPFEAGDSVVQSQRSYIQSQRGVIQSQCGVIQSQRSVRLSLRL